MTLIWQFESGKTDLFHLQSVMLTALTSSICYLLIEKPVEPSSPTFLYHQGLFSILIPVVRESVVPGDFTSMWY